MTMDTELLVDYFISIGHFCGAASLSSSQNLIPAGLPFSGPATTKVKYGAKWTSPGVKTLTVAAFWSVNSGVTC